MALSLPLSTAVIMAGAVLGLQTIAGDGGVSQAQGNGDLLLDWAIEDNTPTSVGVLDTECRTFPAGTLVQIDLIADNAVDWAAIDFVIEYPSPATVIAPGPNDSREGGAFDFVPFDSGNIGNTAGAENFLFPDGTDTVNDYSTTESVSDSNSRAGRATGDWRRPRRRRYQLVDGAVCSRRSHSGNGRRRGHLASPQAASR